MEGNASFQDEDDFVDAMSDEMPEVFNNIKLSLDQIDEAEDLLKEVIETKSIERMAKLKREVESVAIKVDQTEGLAAKLEAEIYDWDAEQKLVRRDEELEQVQTIA